MPSQYILESQITRLALYIQGEQFEVWLVRTYEVPEMRGSNTSKSKECLFHDKEGTYIHPNIPKVDVEKYCVVLVEGDTPFLLWDREVSQLVGMSAIALMSNYK
nr:protein FAR1-RELATED SEQUENCE 5-like [Ipomoea batatas]